MVDKLNKKLIILSVMIVGLSLGLVARAEVMFEGYSIIRSGTTAIGYTIQRYEFDPKKKQFTSTSFLKTNAAGGDLTESLKAVCNDKFQPVSYQYVTKIGSKAKMIDAKFAKDQMNATVTDGKSPTQVKVAVKKGTFLSTFLGYLMLQNGYKVDKKFTYSAIAEEDGAAYSGEALIKAEEDYKGQKAYRVINNFKGTEFISFVTPKGEALGTTSPLQNISTELVANPNEATKGFVVPADTLKILFGAVPTGKINVLAAKLTTLTGSPAPVKGSPAPTDGTAASSTPTQQSVPMKSSAPTSKTKDKAE